MKQPRFNRQLAVAKSVISGLIYLFTCQSGLATSLDADTAEALPAPEPTAEPVVLRREPWQAPNLVLEMNFDPLISPLLLPKLSSFLLGLDGQVQIGQDLALGLGVGAWTPFPGFTFQSRYYVPESLWSQQTPGEVPSLPFSRLYAELRLAALMTPNPATVDVGNVPSPESGTNTFGYGAAPFFGIESRLNNLISRLAVGFALTHTVRGGLQVSPSMMMGLGYRFSYPTSPSPAYRQAYEAISAKPLRPFVQISRDFGLPEGEGWSAWIMNERWGVGYGQGSLPRLTEGVIDRKIHSLKLRYYFGLQHLGDQAYCEAVAGLTELPSFGFRIGFEQRLADWLSLDISGGVGLGANVSGRSAGPEGAAISILPIIRVSTSFGIPLALAQADAVASAAHTSGPAAAEAVTGH